MGSEILESLFKKKSNNNNTSSKKRAKRKLAVIKCRWSRVQTWIQCSCLMLSRDAERKDAISVNRCCASSVTSFTHAINAVERAQKPLCRLDDFMIFFFGNPIILIRYDNPKWVWEQRGWDLVYVCAGSHGSKEIWLKTCCISAWVLRFGRAALSTIYQTWYQTWHNISNTQMVGIAKNNFESRVAKC